MSSDPRHVPQANSQSRARFASVPEDETLVSSFVTSMPRVYSERFAPDVVRQHAQIVLQRGDAPAFADLWERLPGGNAAICVVADDRPGLLSLISLALVRHGLDVSSAQIYGRQLPGGTTEAVDLFWVSRSDARRGHGVQPPDRLQISAMGRTLGTLIERAESVAREGTERPASIAAPPADKPRRTRFAFEAEDCGCVLIVEAADRPGLLLAIARAMFDLGVQIVRSDVMTIRGRAVDRFHVSELDGRPLSPTRRSQIELAIDHVLDQPFGHAQYSEGAPVPKRR